jgi:hypothetical protein
LHKAPVLICENAKGEVTILYKNKPLAYTTYKKLAVQSEIVDPKHLNRAVPLPKPPAANHPWRTYGKHLNDQPIQEALPLAQTKPSQIEFSAFWPKNWQKQKGQNRSVPARLWHSCQRSGRSPALPYPLHECQQFTTDPLRPFSQGTFLLCRKGDISILH